MDTNKFSFIGVPLPDVVKEIERQYDIHVSTTSTMDSFCTGIFKREELEVGITKRRSHFE